MTHKDKIIDMIVEKTGADRAAVERGYMLVHKKECDIFCSYMGDYDHPEEREEAEQEFNEKATPLDHTIDELLKRGNPIGNYYNEHFHDEGIRG